MAKSLFQRLLEGAEDVIEKAKKPIIKRKNERALEEAYYDAMNKRLDAEKKLADLRAESVSSNVLNSKIMEDNINDRIDCQEKIDRATRTMNYIKKEFKDLFDKDLDVEEIIFEYPTE